MSLVLIGAFLCLPKTSVAGTEYVDIRLIRLGVLPPQHRVDYTVTFVSRGGSLSGHAFVVFGVDSDVTARCSQEAFGLYPKNAASSASVGSAFGTVPGNIVNEFTKRDVAGRTSLSRAVDLLIVRVDHLQFAETQRILEAYRTQNDFQLLARDCVVFTNAIATALGLVTPARDLSTPSSWMPVDYVKHLTAENTKVQEADVPQGHYTGTFYQGKPNGDGSLRYSNGDTYTGAFKSGLPDGKGRLTRSSSTLEGSFSAGRPVRGTYNYINGDKYTIPDGAFTFSGGGTFKGLGPYKADY